MKEVVSAVRPKQLPPLRGSGRRSGEREHGTPPFILGLRRTSRCRSPRRPSWGPTRVILLDSEEMGVRAVRRPITNTIRFLKNYTSTITLCGVPGPRAICKKPWLDILKVLRVGSFLPSYVSTFLRIPHLFHLHIRTVLHSHIVKTSRSTATMTSGSIGTYSIDIDPIGEHTEKRLVTLLASTFSYGANLSCFL